MTRAAFPTAPRTAVAVRDALREGRTESANRLITELISWVIHLDDPVPAAVLDEPTSTGDQRYDTLLGTALAYALTSRGESPAGWMQRIRPLPKEWLWDGDEDASAEFREYIRRQTPTMFRMKSILLRERDLIAP